MSDFSNPSDKPQRNLESNGSDTPDVIQPIHLSVKNKKSRQIGAPASRNRSAMFLAAALIATLLCGVALLTYLSNRPVKLAPQPVKTAAEQKQPPTTANVASPQSSPSQPVAPSQLAVDKQEAENRLADFLQIKKSIDEIGAQDWGGELYTTLDRLNQEADALFINKEYQFAAAKYIEAGEYGRQLFNQADQVFQQLVADGFLALAEDHAEIARDKFAMAVKIRPNDERARRGAQRAENAATVIQLRASGKRHETDGNLALAYADYQEAVRLDPESAKAQEALKRVKGRIAEQQFKQLMSEGLTAYHQQQYQQARQLLLKARKYRPDSKEVQDALIQVDDAMRLARIRSLEKSALLAEKNEDWSKALKLYTDVLKIDGSIKSAVEGKQRSQQRIQLNKRIDFYLQKPDTLASDHYLAKAISLLNTAEQIKPKGPKYQSHLSRFQQLVAEAQVPVKVHIESDNQTEISVYKVGNLGRFDVRELTLRPGIYTVIGARDGFKDVRQELKITSKQQFMRIRIVCSEPI